MRNQCTAPELSSSRLTAAGVQGISDDDDDDSKSRGIAAIDMQRQPSAISTCFLFLSALPIIVGCLPVALCPVQSSPPLSRRRSFCWIAVKAAFASSSFGSTSSIFGISISNQDLTRIHGISARSLS